MQNLGLKCRKAHELVYLSKIFSCRSQAQDLRDIQCFFLNFFFKQNFFTSSWTSAGFSEDITYNVDYAAFGITYSAVFFEPRDEQGKQEKLVCYTPFILTLTFHRK
jgi:hypothetical protein